MKKSLRFNLIFIVAFTATIGVNVWLDERNYYEIGENDEFNVDVGDTFTLKLHSNGSTGCTNCFLKQVKVLKLIEQKYASSVNEALGYVGAGGTTAYTFQADKAGTDTIKVAFCRTASERKTCKDYNDKNTKPDNVFIVTVR